MELSEEIQQKKLDYRKRKAEQRRLENLKKLRRIEDLRERNAKVKRR